MTHGERIAKALRDKGLLRALVSSRAIVTNKDLDNAEATAATLIDSDEVLAALEKVIRNGWFAEKTIDGAWEIRDRSGNVIGHSHEPDDLQTAIDAALAPTKTKG